MQKEILEALQNYTVVIFLAGTGTGKSTQLPQYILDDVVAESDTRRVAVLQVR